jgi:large subunit ribosomal protein L21
MKIAVIKTGGKQYKVKEGETIKIEKLLEKAANDKVTFNTLLLADSDGSSLQLGTPSLGEQVTGEVIGNGKADKVVVVKYKNKTRYKKTTGHRQEFTAVKITSIA